MFCSSGVVTPSASGVQVWAELWSVSAAGGRSSVRLHSGPWVQSGWVPDSGGGGGGRQEHRPAGRRGDEDGTGHQRGAVRCKMISLNNKPHTVTDLVHSSQSVSFRCRAGRRGSSVAAGRELRRWWSWSQMESLMTVHSCCRPSPTARETTSPCTPSLWVRPSVPSTPKYPADPVWLPAWSRLSFLFLRARTSFFTCNLKFTSSSPNSSPEQQLFSVLRVSSASRPGSGLLQPPGNQPRSLSERNQVHC